MKHGSAGRIGRAVQELLSAWGRPWSPPSGDDVLLALDDTDNLESPGTGFRARELSLQLAQLGLAWPVAITRHQLLVHDDIPFTSHNSSACIVLRDARDAGAVFEHACSYLRETAAQGSDVGVALLQRERVDAALRDWGARAKQQVLRLDDARALARATGLRHAELSGTGGGLIGALAAIGLHVTGSDGRMLWLHGIRELAGQVQPVAALRQRIGLQVLTLDGRDVGGGAGAHDAVDLSVGDWPQAIYRGHRPVLLVEENHEDPSRARWRCVCRDVVRQLSA